MTIRVTRNRLHVILPTNEQRNKCVSKRHIWQMRGGGAVTTMCNTPPPFQCSRDKIFLAGDFNINVLNHDSHCETDAFLNLVYSNKCFPVITFLPDF